jgi:hypothetical protein
MRRDVLRLRPVGFPMASFCRLQRPRARREGPRAPADGHVAECALPERGDPRGSGRIGALSRGSASAPHDLERSYLADTILPW